MKKQLKKTCIKSILANKLLSDLFQKTSKQSKFQPAYLLTDQPDLINF